ncbi:MAG: DNA polymerase III subunit beta [Thermoleophilia bacterium]|nr:DNA polymerase III subunit beta [Thermoleophilia bacterium]
MKIVTTKQALVDCLGVVTRAISSRSSIQVLSGVLVDAKSDRVVFSGTDMEISLQCPLDARVEEPGSTVIPARVAAEVARALPVGEVRISQEPGASLVELRGGGSVFQLRSLPAVDFPQLPTFPPERVTVSRAAFLETIERVAPSASKDETRPLLTGILVHVEENYVRMVATDSYRLSVKETPLQSSVEQPLEAIIPAKSLTELARIASSAHSEELTLTITENQVLFEVEGISLISRLLDGQFPNYRQLIPDTFDYEVKFDRDELLEAIRRVSVLAQKGTPLRLRFSDNTLVISAEAQDVGRAYETLPVAFTAEELQIGFNPEFLEAGVAAVKDPEVYLRFISPLRPGLITGPSDDFLYLVMPIRLSD